MFLFLLFLFFCKINSLRFLVGCLNFHQTSWFIVLSNILINFQDSIWVRIFSGLILISSINIPSIFFNLFECVIVLYICLNFLLHCSSELPSFQNWSLCPETAQRCNCRLLICTSLMVIFCDFQKDWNWMSYRFIYLLITKRI